MDTNALHAIKVYKSWQIYTHQGHAVSGNYHKTKKLALQEAADFEALLPADAWAKDNPFEGIDGELKEKLMAVKRKWRA